MKTLNAADDDEDWLDALAGAPNAAAAPATLMEATLMRAALQSWSAPREEAQPSPVASLLARARAEGLLPAAPDQAALWRRLFSR